MKDIVKTLIVAVLLVIAIVVVVTTRGQDTMNWKMDFSVDYEETFNYSLAPNSANGEYKNTKGNRHYIMFGQNSDGTYRFYVIHIVPAVFGSSNKEIVVRVDDAKLDSNKSCSFTTDNGTKMKFRLLDGAIDVTSDMSLGDSAIEGNYTFQKAISRLSLDEVQIYD